MSLSELSITIKPTKGKPSLFVLMSQVEAVRAAFGIIPLSLRLSEDTPIQESLLYSKWQFLIFRFMNL